jgi:hypothetical protein
VAIATCKEGGACVIKTFTPFLKDIEKTKDAPSFYLSVLALYCNYFKQVILYKPITSSIQSGEYYVIGKEFRGVMDDEISQLLNILDKFEANNTIYNKVPSRLADFYSVFLHEIIRDYSNAKTTYVYLYNCLLNNDREGLCAAIFDSKKYQYYREKNIELWMNYFDFK